MGFRNIDWELAEEEMLCDWEGEVDHYSYKSYHNLKQNVQTGGGFLMHDQWDGKVPLENCKPWKLVQEFRNLNKVTEIILIIFFNDASGIVILEWT